MKQGIGSPLRFVFFPEGGRTYTRLYSCGILKCRFAFLFRGRFLDLLGTSHAHGSLAIHHIYSCTLLYTALLIVLSTLLIYPDGGRYSR